MRLSTKLLAAAALTMALACGNLDREQGVCLPNQMDQTSWGYLEKHKLLGADEKLLAYYDDTLSLDGTDLAVITTKRVLTFNNGNTTAIPLAEVESISKVDVPMAFGLQVVGRDGSRMQIEIAMANGGETFESVLRDAVQRAAK